MLGIGKITLAPPISNVSELIITKLLRVLVASLAHLLRLSMSCEGDN
ncbi:hypothetical protein VTO7225_03014 [Vibrio toranzoniae]|nr:hypothetical protein VTO7225_03014 [Vibrio toranzoniae]